MKKIAFFLLISLSSIAQDKSYLGLNLPLLLNNNFELSFQKNINKNLSGIVTGGFSTGTKSIGNGNVWGSYRNNNTYQFDVENLKTKGAYGKTGLFFNFNLPDFDADESETSNFRLFVGPIIVASSTTQTGIIKKTTFPVFDEKGGLKSAGVTTSTNEEESTFGFNVGFSLGFTIASKKDISANFGADFTNPSFDDSKFESYSRSLGNGATVFIRVNHAIGKKKK